MVGVLSVARRRPGGAALVAVAAVALGLLGGCSRNPDRLEAGSVEQEVARAVADQVAPPIADVRCPKEIPLAEGTEVECAVVLAEPSGTLPVRVVQRDGEGHLAVEPLRAVLSAPQVADQLEAALDDEFGRSFEADCGKEEAKVREPAAQLLCRASDETSRRQVVVTIGDEVGTLTFEVIDP